MAVSLLDSGGFVRVQSIDIVEIGAEAKFGQVKGRSGPFREIVRITITELPAC
ncbi:hypothetical protein [Mesorhizobium sp.]|uniref:hypothetical protein n=1 Tax=Mesorhizobium sp. TaxID=1871066 RepID=UPI00257EDF00|nr:hypothetical protein [Mesorhizobium sp.]